MIFSLQLAELPASRTLAVLRAGRHAASQGAQPRYLLGAVTAPLSERLLPAPKRGGVALLAAFDDQPALESFLAEHPLAAQMAAGWRVRLDPTRIFGAWRGLGDLPREEQAMAGEEPVAVLTLGRLRLTQTVRFLRASAAAEGLAIRDPALLASTGLAHPSGIVATFSLWRSVAAMRAYAVGRDHPGHLAATRAHRERPFHHESAFIRLRPSDAQGSWNGGEPLAEAAAAGGV